MEILLSYSVKFGVLLGGSTQICFVWEFGRNSTQYTPVALQSPKPIEKNTTEFKKSIFKIQLEFLYFGRSFIAY